MEAHLQKGGHVGFSNDRYKTWLSWIGNSAEMSYDTVNVLNNGDSKIDCFANPIDGSSPKYANFFKHSESSGVIGSGDVLHIDGAYNSFNHEELVVNSPSLFSAGTLDR